MNHRIPSISIAASLLAASAGAQDSFQFVIDQQASAWTWTGTTGIGTIVGDPDHDFNLSGTVEMLVDGNATQHVASGQFLSAEQHIVPNPLRGHIPNPIPGFPDLADIEIHDLVISISSPPFTVAAGGGFSTVLTTTVTQGTVEVTPLGGGSTSTDLAGTVGPNNNVSGTLEMRSNRVELNSPQSASFPFTDSGSGIQGNFTIDGVLNANFGCGTGVNYCTAAVNSTGSGAVMSKAGSSQFFLNNLVLRAEPVPQQPGLFFYGGVQANVPFGNGFRCVGGQLVRLPVIMPQNNLLRYPVDYATLPPSGVIAPGVTKYFQAWFRDPAGGGAAFNLSDGFQLQFCP